MADFDPAAYLARKQASAPPPPAAGGAAPGGFDPAAYLARKGAAPQPYDTIVQEMHPDFGNVDRALVKNFANDDKAAVAYLQKQYPGLEVKTSKTGQIIARKPGEKEYRALDPENGLIESLNPFRKETWRDLADAGTDIATGALSSAATAAGGLAGAAAGGVGAVPGAMLAGGTSSAALEGLRQLAGGALGINKEANWGDVGLSGAAGAAAPLLMGTGATAKQALKAGVSEASQRGLLGLARDNVVKPLAAKVGGMLSGTGPDALATLAKNFPRFEKTTKSRTGVIDFIDETGKMVDQRFKTEKDRAWSEFTDAIGDYGDEATVDLAPLKQRWQAAIAEAQQRAASGTEAAGELLDRLTGAYDKYLRHTVTEEVPEVVEKGTGLLDAYGREIKTQATEVTKKAVRKDLEALSPKQAVELEKQLGELAGFQKIDSRQVSGNRFSPSNTADDKHLMTVAADLKRTLGASVEAVIPENAIPAKRRYGELLGLEKNIEALTGNPRQAFTNLRNADVSSNITNIQQFRQIDDLVGTDLEARAKFAEAVDLFGPNRKSFFQGGGWKDRVPAGLAGAALGGYIQRDQGMGGSLQGSFLGGALGSLLGSPASMRAYIKYGLKAGNARKALAPLGVGLTKEAIDEQQSPWTNMRRPE